VLQLTCGGARARRAPEAAPRARRRAAAQETVAARGAEGGPLRILLLSEGNVCRSVLAEALLARELAARGLAAAVQCESKGARAPARGVARAAQSRGPASCAAAETLRHGC
jgi:hypothetical protein